MRLISRLSLVCSSMSVGKLRGRPRYPAWMYTVRSPGDLEMNTHVRPLGGAILLFAVPCLFAASLPKSSPEEVGLSADRLKRVHALVQRYIDKAEIAGARWWPGAGASRISKRRA